jgi:hypothetical protein
VCDPYARRAADFAVALCKPKGGGEQRALFWLKVYKDNVPCADCGLLFPHWVMETEHIDGSTYRGRVQKTGRRPSNHHHTNRRDILEGRAEVTDANCHKERTHYRKVTA